VRIIAGEFRGRRIGAPPGHGTRPMLDRVREALFSTLQPWLTDATVLDLFAGTGSLGLEALSRGARRVRFVERGRPALDQLRKNVDALGVRDRVEIVVGDALRPSTWLPTADVVLVDPPFALIETARDEVLRAIAELVAHHLAPGGIVILHVARAALRPDDTAAWAARLRRYGTNDLWYIQTPEAGA
jgi:16S rRNA (guanine(966)-N(2))-methyltransferase RsmD